MKQYQIIERKARGEQWKFAAHGARWDEIDARAHVALIKANGRHARLIAV